MRQLLNGISAAALLLGAGGYGSAQLPAGAAQPDPHAILAMEEGIWDAAITFPSREAGTPPTTARGVQVNEFRSGGKWMLNRFSVDGTPYEGTGIWGADRTTGRFSGIWTDNNDAQIRLDDGRWDAATNAMTWSANMLQTDGSWLRLLTIESFHGDRRTFRSVALTRRGEVPLVEIVFTRRPASH